MTAPTPPVACVRIGSCTDQRQGRIVTQSPPQLLFLALVQCTIESPPARPPSVHGAMCHMAPRFWSLRHGTISTCDLRNLYQLITSHRARNVSADLLGFSKGVRRCSRFNVLYSGRSLFTCNFKKWQRLNVKNFVKVYIGPSVCIHITLTGSSFKKQQRNKFQFIFRLLCLVTIALLLAISRFVNSWLLS